jgi:tetratricopeptide (TPR) repeat protein
LREAYCSVDCQKGDWKTHKAICKFMKKLSFQLQPYHEVGRVIEEIREEISLKKKGEMRVLGHLISYALYQFGDRVLGKAYRVRGGNIERIDNWKVEVGILIPIYIDVVSVLIDDKSLSAMVIDNLTFPYYEKMLDILRPWSAYLDLSSTSHIGSLDKDQINHTLLCFSQTEWNIARIHTRRSQSDRAENHCQQALSFARMYEGEEELKTDLLFKAFRRYSIFHTNQGNYDEALTFAEEAYNCVAIAYNPVHPEVQNAASTLIECLTCKGDFDRAETFAQMTLDCLKDPGNGLDQQSEAVARGYHDLGAVINQQKGDYVKAERLARESLRIRSHLYDAHHQMVGLSIGLLASILQSQGNLGSETRQLYEHSLTIDIKKFGSEGVNTAISNQNIGNFYYFRAEVSEIAKTKKDNLQLSESKYKESLRIYTKVLGPDNPRTIRASSALSIVSRKLSEA